MSCTQAEAGEAVFDAAFSTPGDSQNALTRNNSSRPIEMMLMCGDQFVSSRQQMNAFGRADIFQRNEKIVSWGRGRRDCTFVGRGAPPCRFPAIAVAVLIVRRSDWFDFAGEQFRRWHTLHVEISEERRRTDTRPISCERNTRA